MNTPSTKLDVMDFDPNAFGRHLARELPRFGDADAQVHACDMVEEGLRFIWRCQGVPATEIEARNTAWSEAFRRHLRRQTENVTDIRCEANASAEH